MIILLHTLIIVTSSALNVLMIAPTLSYSHIAFNAKIAEVLTSKGHTVVMLIPDVDNQVPSPIGNFEVIRRDVGLAPKELATSLWTNPGPYEDSSLINPRIFIKLLRVSSLFVKACEALASNRTLLNSLRKRQFDVGMLEQYDSCGFGIFRAVGVNNIVWLSATGIYAEQPQTIGVNYPLSYVPNLFAPLGDEMSLIDRAQNLIISSVTSIFFSYNRAQQSKIFWRTGDLQYGEDLIATARSSDSVLVNSLPLLDFAMPSSNKMAYIGGLTVQKQPERLEMFWKQLADSSTRGFILVTFGSIARTMDMTLKMQNNFFTAFSRFPEITFIAKYEAENCTVRVPPNVQLTHWIPQAKLMAHPNYLAMITHGGWSSILESISAGKPLVLMPLFADHGKNSKAVEAKGAAIVLDKMNMRVFDLIKAIAKVTTKPRYHNASIKLSQMMDDASPLNSADLLDYQIRRAAKPNRKRFPLTPRGSLRYSLTDYLEIFIGISIALVQIVS